jgi:hypothetical protein
MSVLSAGQVQQLAPVAATALFSGSVPTIPPQPSATASVNLLDIQNAIRAIDAACDASSGSNTALAALTAAIPAPCSALPAKGQTILVLWTILKRAALI